MNSKNTFELVERASGIKKINEKPSIPLWRVERTGWRDSEISQRHGAWGFNCPAVDLDFVMMEFNHGKPCAIIEYKHKNAKQVDPKHATYKALRDLADNYWPRPLPCLVARYDPETWNFLITPLNEAARKYYSHCIGEVISEKRFVKSLHLMRKKSLSQEDIEAIERLNG